MNRDTSRDDQYARGQMDTPELTDGEFHELKKSPNNNFLLKGLAGTLRTRLPAHCATHIDAAVFGDADAADSLTVACPNEYRGALAVAFWNCGVATPAFRAVLTSVWDHDHRYLIKAARTRGRLQAMFRSADILNPVLPDVMSVWRGTIGLPRSRAMRGIAWSLDRDTACWFAMRYAEFKSRPMVLRAQIPASAVALYHDKRDEREIVTFEVHHAVIDGGEHDWREGAKRRQNQTMAKQEEMLAHYRQRLSAL